MAPATAADLVGRYARSFNATHLGAHGSASPLGLWLLLALVAPAAQGANRAGLEEVLGTGADEAAAAAAELLGRPHPAVAAAVAVWARRTLLDAGAFDRWAAALPAGVETGDVPGRADADRWASGRTAGLVGRFPAEPGPGTAVVLASAVATRVSWADPFDEADAAELGGEFGSLAASALRAPPSHRRFLARTAAAGVVGVHAAESADGLLVVSVIAAPDVEPPAVHRAAAEAASAVVGGAEPQAERLSLFDVPPGEGHAWTMAEREVLGPGAPAEVVDALVVAWSAESHHDLLATAGVPEATATLERFLAPAGRPGSFEARQVAVASYGREGFEAAAVTVLHMRATGAVSGGPVVQRHAILRFNRPYAVLAVARSESFDGDRVAGPAWDGLGVFSAWVASPER